MRLFLTCAATMLLLAAAPAPPPNGSPVALQPRPGTPLDKEARALVAQDLGEARANRDKPLLLIGTARLGPATDKPALFVQLQSARECGSAGCTTGVYYWVNGAWKKVLDGTSGVLTVSTRRTRGMADLLSGNEHYAWTGTEYRDTNPAPAIDLRPRPPRR